ncbi:TonB-dependent receptor [Olivibacter sp. XZL3]|uniref:SusC/RagA family TonB-linked outer membrane protein n=1 Tax=Olivibacter sp. XZL3 TaxID=1735116 RepID=UPI00106566C9|nr:TonB-dependent receptor [Olivibacter sp. XZL3]
MHTIQLLNGKRGMVKFAVSVICLLCSSVCLWAQVTITGLVRDESGAPLPGVSVKVKNANTGVSTNEEGRYQVEVPGQQAVLVFSFVSYTTQEIAVQGKNEINVTLLPEENALDEVVVVGYGTQQKRDLTGAVSVVKTSELTKRRVTTMGEALQGLASGVKVRGGGGPGSEAKVEIRGLKNLSGTNPLYVIDGMITTANRDFNPNDIESVQILKDASAAAIYGSRAANGVIIITTKKGAKGPMKVEFSGTTSMQTTPRYKLAQTEEFARLNYMAYDNAMVDNEGLARQDLDLSQNTDWQEAAFRTGNMQDLNLTFSGGGESGSYLVSGNYFGNEGTVISTDFDRISFRVNTQGTKGIFSIGENLAISNAKTDEMSGNPYADVVRLLPTIPIYNPNNPGGYGYGDERRARTFGSNPLALADLDDRYNENLRIRGNVWSELKPVEFLKYRFNLGYETSSDHYAHLRKEGNWSLNQEYQPSIADENRARFQSMLVENTLTFNKDFGKHIVNAVVGQTYQKDQYARISGMKRNLVPDGKGGYYSELDQGNEPQAGGYREEAIILSYLARVEYNYDNRYLLNGVIRRDGSSRLGRSNQWGNFPSISGAWRISNEKFFQKDWVNDLKLRASYGQLGNSNIGYWDYLAVINTFSTIAMGRDQLISPGAIQVALVNPNLRWETLTQKNFGVDATLLDNKISLTAEYFIADTKDVLTAMPIALTTGHDGDPPIANAASLKNTGFELSLGYNESSKEFKYYINTNVTTLKNKVTNLGYGRNNIFVGNTVTQIGQPAGMWFVLETDGLFQSEEEVANYTNAAGQVIQPAAKPGDIRYKDNNGDGQITNDDKVVVGSPWSDVELGINLGASYKNFSLTMNWFGAFGATVYNGYHSLVDRFDDNSNYRAGIQPWTPENPNTDIPRMYYGSTLNSRGDTDRWLESGNFMRLKYISLSYALPDSWLKRIGFQSGQIILSGQNLLTFTKYQGLDPEFNNASIYERGFDNFSYPNLKTYSLGLQFGF